jgi:hypothetical protein
MAQEMLIGLAFRRKRQPAISSEASHLPLPQPYQHDGRRRFYLAVQIECSKSTQRYDISRLRNRALHVSAHAIHAHAECSPLRRSTTAEPSCARCKQSARPATRMTIGRHCMRRPTQDLLILGCRFHFRLSFNNDRITDAAALRICTITVILQADCYVDHGPLIRTVHKKSRGRPAGVKFGETIPARFEPATVAALDKWAVAHDVSRSEAIRQLVELGLKAKGK